ncbi:MAG: hypothetical protein ACI8TX_000141 [Hyphomicrobiaceae bacterium]|jgi:hypothetical protein
MRALTISTTIAFAALGAGAVLFGVPTTAAADDQPTGRIVLQANHASVDHASVDHASVSDDDAAFQRRVGIPNDVSGGIQSVEIERAWGDDGTLSFDGRAIIDAGDYLGSFKLELPERGFLEAGYKQYRTWQDRTGNFFPGDGGLFLPTEGGDEAYLERGNAWFRAGLRRPNVPELTVGYRYRYRDGSRASLVRGDVNTAAFGGSSGVKNIGPAVSDIDERVHTVEADIRHRFNDVTMVGGGARYETSEINNTRGTQRRPGEAGRMRWVSQRDEVRNDSLTLRGFGEHRMADDAVIVSAMYAYSDLDSDGGGSRIYGASVNPVFDAASANRQSFDRGFLDLDTNVDVEHHSAAFNVSATPVEDLRILVQARLKAEEADGTSAFTDTLVSSALGLPTETEGVGISSSADETIFTQVLELRYTGIETLSLSVRAEFEESDRDVTEEVLAGAALTPELAHRTDTDGFAQQYGLRLRWYPSTRGNLSAGYSYRKSDEDFDDRVDSTSNDPGTTVTSGSLNRYPAYISSQDVKTHRWYLKGSLRPTSFLRLGANYNFRITERDTGKAELAVIETARIDTHHASVTATLSPIANGWIQGEVGRVWSETQTPVSDLTGAAGGLVADFDNDFWNARLAAGKALSEHTDVEFLYNGLFSDNYDDLSPVSLGYGSNLEEHRVTVGLAHRVQENILLRARYGFIDSQDETFGGRNDYQASILQTSLEYGF